MSVVDRHCVIVPCVRCDTSLKTLFSICVQIIDLPSLAADPVGLSAETLIKQQQKQSCCFDVTEKWHE